jgi:predicted dehydrogenase
MEQELESRRTFIQKSAMRAGYTATALGYPTNETIHVGCIGTGGRCRELMRSLQQLSGVRITAVADIWDVNLAEAQKLADGKVFATRDYRELLRRSDVDAVVIGAPDHWHAQMTIDACEAGKDVYVEKPLTHDMAEGRRVIAAQNARKLQIRLP